MTWQRQGPAPLAGGNGASKNSKAAKLADSQDNQPRQQIQPPFGVVDDGDLPLHTLHEIWWRQWRAGYRLSAEPGVIVIEGALP